MKRYLYIVLILFSAILNCRAMHLRQITNYYAYGTFMGDVSRGTGIQTDRYTGKELDREAGLDLYDYGARQYDATVGLFTSMDPMCEQYYHLNPYLYCAGNPVRYVDPGDRGTGTCHETVGSK